MLAAATVLASAAACRSPGSGDPADPRWDVIVVGAGMAGLAAAGALARAGRSVVVLEARDRPGGRIQTSELLPGLPVDLGASWIHGTDGNPVYRAAGRFGLDTAVFDVGSWEGAGSSVLYAPGGTRLDTDTFDEQVATILDELERLPGPGTSMAAGLDALPAPLRAAARRPEMAGALSVVAADFGADPDQLSVRALAEQDSFPGPQRVFPGGFGQLTGRLAEGLDIRYRTRVAAIALPRAGGAVVDTGDSRWTARAVIVTVPLGVLKAGSIRFDPPLPDRHRRAVGALGNGRYEKLVLAFESAFWDDVDEIAIAGRDGEPFSRWYNLTRVTGRPVLMALNGGAAAAALAGLPASRQAALAGETLSAILRGRYRPPLAVLASDWWSDPMSRGSYSFNAVGSSAEDRAALGTGVEDRLWLAGEAVHPTLHSTVHGAWLSGRRAAEQVPA